MSCIDNILKCYEEKSSPSLELMSLNTKSLWASKIIIRLTQNLKQHSITNEELRNCLILVLNLFLNLNTPDYITNKGKDVSLLDPYEKEDLLNILKKEFKAETFFG